MLAQLARYALDRGLAAEPGFASKAVRWNLAFRPDGSYLGTFGLGDSEAKKNPGHSFPRCPELSQPEIKRGGSGCRHFLVDSADVATLYSDTPDDPKILAKHAYFVGLLRQASAVVPDLAVPAAGLEDPEVLAQIAADLRSQKAKPTDKVTVSLEGRSPAFFVEGDDWHDWWRSFRRGLGRDSGAAAAEPAAGTFRCLVSGELVAPTPTHPKINGLSDVGGLAMGDVLASFKQDSFCSYGLEQAANAAVSEENAAAYRAALNHLLAHQSERLAHVKVVYWFQRAVPREDNPFLLFFAGDPSVTQAAAHQQARQLLRSVQGGELPPNLQNNRYAVLTLSGASGRVMVRDWQEGSFEELVEALNAWFDDLEIVHREGGRSAPVPKFHALLGALVRDKLDEVPAPVETDLWRAVLRPRAPFPRTVMARALARFRADLLAGQPFHHARMALLKAFHVRQGDRHMHPGLNENHPAAAYQCGRLLSLLAAVQYRALGDVGAGVVQRYYAAASATPALVLGRLVRTAQFHLDKLDRGLARFHEARIAGVMSRLEAIPQTLTLDEQSLFALGYYHQIAADRVRTSASAAAAPETAVPQETDHV